MCIIPIPAEHAKADNRGYGGKERERRGVDELRRDEEGPGEHPQRGDCIGGHIETFLVGGKTKWRL